MKEKGFLGMIIPKQYGGLEFSAYAHSQVVTKLSTRCAATAVSVMVPNSLGPAELLLHYGTEEQKNHYLPRLARGLDIPCFALTSPWAGSDAASIPDQGIVCRGMWQGREVVGMRVTWDKRYITLAPVATVVGLAFRLFDPEHLLGDTDDIGITCALVPANHPGVETGCRHFPLNAAWHNGPTRGKDVFMPLDFIIGGPKMAGQGWRMLMECLAAGRSISLPASNTGMQKLAVRTVGGYARVRSQFKTAIGKFEGIQEPLARMGGNLYLCDAARVMTAGVDRPRREALGRLRHRQVPRHRARPPVGQRRHGHPRRQGHLPRPLELPRPRLPADTGGDHRRRRQHPDAQPDHLRPGRDSLPSLCAGGDAGGAATTTSYAFDKALFAHIGHTIGNGLRALFTGSPARISSACRRTSRRRRAATTSS